MRVFCTYQIFSVYDLVPWAGLEPAQHSPLRPQHSVSTNSTTGAKILFIPSSLQVALHQQELPDFPMPEHQIESLEQL